MHLLEEFKKKSLVPITIHATKIKGECKLKYTFGITIAIFARCIVFECL